MTPSAPSRAAWPAAGAPLTPDQLLVVARRYVESRDPDADGSWPRIAAYLARQALETTLQKLWESDPGLAGTGRATQRSQLTCLRQLAEHTPTDGAGSTDGAGRAGRDERTGGAEGAGRAEGPRPTWISAATAAEAAWTWRALCRACHVHPYELLPTSAELSGWIEAVDRFVSAARPLLAHRTR